MEEPANIPFNSPYMTGRELDYIKQAHSFGALAGDGPFTSQCKALLEAQSGSPSVLLTHSCTAALEMTALLIDAKPGDEIIMPSYTFVSTANAFVLRGAVPVFVDIRPDTLNLDEGLIEDAITKKTTAILPMHYAGVGCEMDTICAIAKHHDLHVIEDAAQGVMASYKGRPLGTMGAFGAYSFHETKNVICGEGGALLINDPAWILAAEIVREKGTNRSQFARGEIEKYSWISLGSSFLPGELTAAFLYAQLERAEQITEERLALWNRYHQLLAPLEQDGRLSRPTIPDHCAHNAHMYYVMLNGATDRSKVLNAMHEHGIHCVFHYVPLHSSEAGRKFGRAHGSFEVTNTIWQRIIRLPMWVGLSENQQEQVVKALEQAIHGAGR